MAMLHREGNATIFLAFLFSILLTGSFYFFAPAFVWIAVVISLFVLIIVLQFFRYPTRIAPDLDNQIVLAPCDGKVVVIEETEETEYFKDRRIQVSIFMSPLNVHINWNPIGGKVVFSKYHPGKYLVAWHPKSSTENERTTIVYEAGKAKVLARQIAGALARRIVNYVDRDDVVARGSEMGFIKFGSRVDLFLPLGTELLIEKDQKTVGNKTPIARLK